MSSDRIRLSAMALVAWLLGSLLFASVAQAQTKTKLLYPYDNGQLTRTPQAANTVTPVTIAGGNAFATWTLSPAVAAGKTLSLPAQTVSVVLVMAATNNSTGSARSVNVALYNGATAIGSASQNVVNGNTAYTYSIPIAAQSIAAGGTLGMRVTNTVGQAQRQITVSQKTAVQGAGTVTFTTTTAVNVDSVATYSGAYPAVTTKSTYLRNDVLYVRAVVSDPFGSADVSDAKVTLTDSASATRISAASMTQVASNAASKTYEYQYTLPGNAVAGTWTANVTGYEGSEGTVTHSASGTFDVAVPLLSIAKSHSGNFTAGTNGSYGLVVQNSGGAVSGTTTVTDTLPAGLSYVSGSGTGWSCGAVGQVVTCTSSDTVAGGSSFPTLTLVVAVAGSAGSSVNNVASVSNPSVNGGAAINSNTDATAILHPDLSTSTKVAVDLNGGDADPGDVLRYTITLIESAAATAGNIGVTDNMPAGVTGFTVISTPGGSTNASTGGGGSNGTGYLNVTGIAIPASGSASIVFEVTVAAGDVPGYIIDNTATVANPNGTGAAPAASTITVSQSQLSASGNKLLYVYDNLGLTRTPQATTNTAGVSIGSGVTRNWTLAPAIAAGKSLQLSAGNIAVNLVTNSNFNSVTVQASLWDGATQIGTTATQNFSNSTPTPVTFTIPLAAPYTLAAGGQLVLRIVNASGGNRPVSIYQYNAGRSTVSFATSTVVNVDSLATYAAAYPSTTTRAFHSSNDTVYVRAVVSDPFGSADVSAAEATLTDSNGAVQLNAASMSVVASDAASKTFEYAYLVPVGAAIGVWTASVTGHEGTEGTISHTYNIPIGVGVARLTLAKSHTGNFTAGTNGSYAFVVHNNGLDVAGPTTVTDTLPAGLTYVSGTGTGWSCGAAGQVVTCTSNDLILASSNLPTLTLVVAVAGSAANSVDNTATISNPNVDSGNPQNSNSDATTILHPDLSTSNKVVVDLNGGDAEPGDTLRYTITLVESAAAAAGNIGVTDNMPAGITGFTVISTPGGSINASTGGGGSNGTGYLDVSGISIPAGGSASIVFDVTVGVGASPGDAIDNTATVANPNGAGATPAASTVTVSQSQLSASGNKVLYVYDNLGLTRTPQATANTAGVVVAAGGNQTWTLSPAIPAGKSLVLSAGNIAVNLMVNSNFSTVSIQAQLFDGATLVGSSTVQNFNIGAPTLRAFAIALASDYTLVAGRTLSLRLANSATGNKDLTVYQYNGGASTISFATSTVVNVDSVTVYDAAYPAITTRAHYVHGETVYVRAVVSDPFGSADVGAAELTLTDSAANVRLTAAAISEVAAATTASSKTFEYAYVLPADSRLGSWTASVLAHEGSEGTVSHAGNAAIDVRGRITLGKAWASANAGDTVDLAVTGGTDAVAGSSTAPATTTVATADSIAAATITLAETYTVGLPGNYTPSLACSKDSDASAITATGSGLSHSITMPDDSSVTCTWTNEKTVPLTMVKLSTVYSDPVNGTANPKAIPGAFVDYQVIVANPSANPIDAGSVVVTDPVPAYVDLWVGDYAGAGTGPVLFIDGAPSSGLAYAFTSLSSATDDISFSSDGGATWGYTPTPDANGCDPAVTDIRINPKGVFNGNSAQFTLKFRVRVQ
jgi:uncharacterized repeat protein (TIGR01451 family)